MRSRDYDRGFLDGTEDGYLLVINAPKAKLALADALAAAVVEHGAHGDMNCHPVNCIVVMAMAAYRDARQP